MSEPTISVDDQKLMEEVCALPKTSLRWQRAVGLEVYRPRKNRRQPDKKRATSEVVACMFVHEEPDRWRWWLKRSDSIEWLSLSGGSTEAVLLKWFLGRQDAKRMIEELCTPALERYESLEPIWTGSPAGNPNLIVHYKGGELEDAVTQLSCAMKPAWPNGSREGAWRHPSPQELAEYASRRKQAKPIDEWRAIDFKRRAGAQKPGTPPEPGYPTMIASPKDPKDRRAVYSKAQHDSVLAEWGRAPQPASAAEVVLESNRRENETPIGGANESVFAKEEETPKSFPNRSAWLKREMADRGFRTPYQLQQAGGPDVKTIQRIQEARPVRWDSLDRIAKGLSTRGTHVTSDSIPRD